MEVVAPLVGDDRVVERAVALGAASRASMRDGHRRRASSAALSASPSARRDAQRGDGHGRRSRAGHARRRAPATLLAMITPIAPAACGVRDLRARRCRLPRSMSAILPVDVVDERPRRRRSSGAAPSSASTSCAGDVERRAGRRRRCRWSRLEVARLDGRACASRRRSTGTSACAGRRRRRAWTCWRCCGASVTASCASARIASPLDAAAAEVVVLRVAGRLVEAGVVPVSCSQLMM